MRNPDRLDEFYDKLKWIHKTYFPDWRFTQFMINFRRWQETHCETDGWYLEEDKALERLMEYVNWCRGWGK